ncbi:PLP-dependent transferase [Staphylococcus aureus]
MEYHSANPPLYDSSTFHQTSLGGDVKYKGIASKSNRELLEEKLARLEQGKFAFAFASVLLNSAVLLTFKSGDHIIYR